MGNNGGLVEINLKVTPLAGVFEGKGLDFFKDIGNFRYCPTGEPYWTVLSEGIVPEGSKSEIFKSKEEAVDAWEENVGRIIDQKKQLRSDPGVQLTVFWRWLPEIRVFTNPDEGFKRWKVYSRFRISSLPIIQSADYNEVHPTWRRDYGYFNWICRWGSRCQRWLVFRG